MSEMTFWIQMMATVVCSVLASSGLWTYVSKRSDKNDAKTELLIGIAHDRIIFLGMSYVHRGYITQEEYENLHEYLYEPYKKAGGNGSAERVMREVDKLPMDRGDHSMFADFSHKESRK